MTRNHRRLIACIACLLPGLLATSAFSATLYQCRAYSGGSFWSEQPCDSRQAAIESRHTVPDGLPFKEQVRLVEQASKQTASVQANEEKERERRRKCAAIDSELNQIQGRYNLGQHVPIEQVNQDQKRSRDLKSQRSANKCYQ